MLSKRSIEEYFAKKGRDYTWVKKFKRSQFKRDFYPVLNDVGFKFKTKPYLHQLASFFVGVCEKRWLFLLDMGLGKSKIIIDLISFYKQELGGIRTLVLVPTDVNIEGWSEELELHSDLTFEMLVELNSEKRMCKIKEGLSEVYLLTYPALIHLVCTTKRDKKGVVTGKKVIDKKKISKLLGFFDLLALDEIHKAKNSESLTFKILDVLADDIPLVYGATGTPFGRDPIDLWSQFYLIDGGETFGTTLSFFKNMFFQTRAGFGGRTEYEYMKELDSDLNSKMLNSSLRYEDSECQDLPDKVEIVKHVPFGLEAYSYYKPARDSLKQSQIDGKTELVETNFTKLRELCSGFIILKDEESDTKTTITFANPPKVESLKNVLENLPGDSKLVIYHEFTDSGVLIEKVVKQVGLKYVCIRGGVKDKVGKVREFKDKNSEVSVLIANSESGGVGGNFQKVANYLVFYESPVSPIIRRQCIKRIYRGGQSKKVFIIDLVVKGGVEEKILQYIAEGNDLFEAIVNKKISTSNFRTPLIER